MPGFHKSYFANKSQSMQDESSDALTNTTKASRSRRRSSSDKIEYGKGINQYWQIFSPKRRSSLRMATIQSMTGRCEGWGLRQRRQRWQRSCIFLGRQQYLHFSGAMEQNLRQFSSVRQTSFPLRVTSTGKTSNTISNSMTPKPKMSIFSVKRGSKRVCSGAAQGMVKPRLQRLVRLSCVWRAEQDSPKSMSRSMKVELALVRSDMIFSSTFCGLRSLWMIPQSRRNRSPTAISYRKNSFVSSVRNRLFVSRQESIDFSGQYSSRILSLNPLPSSASEKKKRVMKSDLPVPIILRISVSLMNLLGCVYLQTMGWMLNSWSSMRLASMWSSLSWLKPDRVSWFSLRTSRMLSCEQSGWRDSKLSTTRCVVRSAFFSSGISYLRRRASSSMRAAGAKRCRKAEKSLVSLQEQQCLLDIIFSQSTFLRFFSSRERNFERILRTTRTPFTTSCSSNMNGCSMQLCLMYSVIRLNSSDSYSARFSLQLRQNGCPRARTAGMLIAPRKPGRKPRQAFSISRISASMKQMSSVGALRMRRWRCPRLLLTTWQSSIPLSTSMLMHPSGFLGLKFIERYLPIAMIWSRPKDRNWCPRSGCDWYRMYSRRRLISTETSTCHCSYCVPKSSVKSRNTSSSSLPSLLPIPSVAPPTTFGWKVKPLSLNCRCKEEVKENSSKLSSLDCSWRVTGGDSVSMGSSSLMERFLKFCRRDFAGSGRSTQRSSHSIFEPCGIIISRQEEDSNSQINQSSNSLIHFRQLSCSSPPRSTPSSFLFPSRTGLGLRRGGAERSGAVMRGQSARGRGVRGVWAGISGFSQDS